MTEVFPWRDAPPGDYAVIGDPIAHSKSPAMHAAAYRALGLDLTYRAIHVPVGEVDEALDHLRAIGYRGVNVTIPHKADALAWSVRKGASPDYRATVAGAANTLDLVSGESTTTDGLGFQCSLPKRSGRIESVLLLGAGGTAGTILSELAGWKCRIAIWNRTPERASALISNLQRNRSRADLMFPRGDEPIEGSRKPWWEAEIQLRDGERRSLDEIEILKSPDLSNFDLVLNTTSASLIGAGLGLDWTRAKPGALAYDLSYGVEDAPFLREARQAGLATMDGRAMLAGQGAFSFQWWGLLRATRESLASKSWTRRNLDSRPRMRTDRLATVMHGALS